MKSIQISFQDLFDYLNVGNVKNEIETSPKKIYVPTPYSELVPILGYIKKDNHNIVKVTLKNGVIFKVSDKHLVFENGVCKQIRNCHGVDTIDRFVEIENYEIFSIGDDVYDIALNDPHIYTTPNGVIHHNTTLVCMISEMLTKNGKRAAIASGEESHTQIAYTCKRLGVENVDVAHIKDVEVIAEAMHHYDFMVVDSFQALRSKNSMKKKEFFQYAQDLLLSTAKETGCVLVFILHITTQGLPKGGTDIIHAVDVNVKLTVSKDDESMRIIHVYKNRFGETKQHAAIMGARGFEFQGVYEAPVEEKGSSRGRPNINQERKETIIEDLGDEITLDQVCDSFGVSGQVAGILLRELVGEKKLEKIGRGANAAWKVIKCLS